MDATSRPLRIAYVTETYPPELNGVSLTVRANGAVPARARPQRRADPSAPARRGRARRRRRAAHCRLRRFRCTASCASACRASARCCAASQRTRPELVHLATPGPLAWAALAAARALGIPTTSDFRTNFHQYSRYYGLGALATPVLGLLRRFHNLTELTFVPTRATRARARRLRLPQPDDGRPRRRQRALLAGAPQRRAAPPSGRPRSRRCCSMVGRVAAEKNVELGLRAFERRDASRPGTAPGRRRRRPGARAPAIGASRRSLRRRAARRRRWRRTTRRPTCSCSRA